MVSTDGLPIIADGAHYSGEGQIGLGERFAEAMAEALRLEEAYACASEHSENEAGSMPALGIGRRAPTAFPGAATRLDLGDGEKYLLNVPADQDEPSAAAQPSSHSLYVVDRGTGTRQFLCGYDRHITVLPSPSGHAVAVTDYTGSTEADCLVFVLREERARGLRERLSVTAAGQALPPTNSHTYIEAAAWVSDNELLASVRGYGDADSEGFRLWGVYRVAQDVLWIPQNELEE